MMLEGMHLKAALKKKKFYDKARFDEMEKYTPNYVTQWYGRKSTTAVTKKKKKYQR